MRILGIARRNTTSRIFFEGYHSPVGIRLLFPGGCLRRACFSGRRMSLFSLYGEYCFFPWTENRSFPFTENAPFSLYGTCPFFSGRRISVFFLYGECPIFSWTESVPLFPVGRMSLFIVHGEYPFIPFTEHVPFILGRRSAAAGGTVPAAARWPLPARPH